MNENRHQQNYVGAIVTAEARAQRPDSFRAYYNTNTASLLTEPRIRPMTNIEFIIELCMLAPQHG